MRVKPEYAHNFCKIKRNMRSKTGICEQLKTEYAKKLFLNLSLQIRNPNIRTDKSEYASGYRNMRADLNMVTMVTRFYKQSMALLMGVLLRFLRVFIP